MKYKVSVIPGLTRNLLTFLKIGDSGSGAGMTKIVDMFYSFRWFPSYLFSAKKFPVPRHSSFRPLPQPLSCGERGKGERAEQQPVPRDSLFSYIRSFNRHFSSQRTGFVFLIFSTFVLLFSPPKTNAQDTGSGLDFLNIGPSSRMLSLSEATTALATGSSAIYSNPSLLVLDGQSSLDVSYSLWIANVKNQFAALNLVKDNRAYAFGVYSSASDGFEARDQPGPSAGNFSIRYLSLSGAIAQKLGPFSIGVTGQYLREEVFQFRASGFAFNAGITTSFMDDKIRAAASVKNIGKMESLDAESTPLPSSFNAGISASLIEFNTPGQNDLPVLVNLVADWHQPIEQRSGDDFTGNDEKNGFFTLAMDLNIGDLLFVQGGYRWGPTERPYSVGLGLEIESVRVNYALVPFSTGFGTVHSFGVQYYF